ncbi:hypothetical protein EW093_13860 [Thiospirochaeta perfilievii]|uniref:Uncharacterized protein n=1 Tax=Thiospirochaeta perfilievii TaxID=252967 RepID=A0A5C1QCC5_9SPIO|nr:hypothetical protein [Thiospirochaeta perfilievii]QEN05743.1 hypothetical protein EW093_13860 [Thiospirochaeta perfilievii]
MKKYIIFTTMILLLLSCGTRKQDLRDLEVTLNSVNYALESNNSEKIENAIREIEVLLPKFTKHQALRQKKYQLEIKLKRYEDAINTIDSILKIDPNSIDHRITQGILLEIIGKNMESVVVLEKALELLSNRPETITIGAEKRSFIAAINRVMVLKLLKRDKPEDYDNLRLSDAAIKYPSIAKTINLLELGDRDRLINNYR